MEDIQYRVLLIRLAIVSRRSIDIELSPGTGNLGVVTLDPNVTMRDIFNGIVVVTRKGYFYTARHTPHPIKSLTCRVGDGDTINQQRVVVKAGTDGISHHLPNALIIFHQVILLSQVYLYPLSFRSIDAEEHATSRQDPGEFRRPHI